MKKRMLPLVLALVLILTGCTSMLDRSYQAVTAHDAAPDAEEDSSILRAENYQSLVSDILFFVTKGTGTGTIRLYDYDRDVEADLETACLEVVQEDPLGAYAVEYIKYSVTHIVSYYEAQLELTYRRTPEQISSISFATGTSAIRAELASGLSSFQSEIVLRISSFNEDEAYLYDLIQEAYYNTPAAGFGLPSAEVTLYPESGKQRIVEILLTYPGDTTALIQQSEELMNRAADLRILLLGMDGDAQINGLLALTRDEISYSTTAPGTTYAALVDGTANSEGFALAVKLMCGLVNLNCTIAQGHFEGDTHFWNVIQTASGYRHIDASQGSGTFYTDTQLADAGYSWDADSVPVCEETVPNESQLPT